MRKNIVAGNWKMNTTLPEGLALAKGLNAALKGKAVHCDVIVGVVSRRFRLAVGLATAWHS